MKDYSNAFTEVYEILNHLEIESYNKIPADLIKSIEENIEKLKSILVNSRNKRRGE